ncbi:hypothetical protein C1645_830027 [Glomus cerebriforme]|uniref:Uncharacterized protein n=1 Tax=Glomus cerebriforme TaxID=658196 RepID=A0A397SPI4_9GLOM|nr:hypothetical protein C1645_830027 [Glomus cerebriforme]
MKQGNIVNNTAHLVKEVSNNTAITIFEESQAKDLIISELTANLEVTRNMIAKLQQERTNHTCSSTQTPISIVKSNMEISSGSTSTKRNWDAEKITEEINKHLGSLIKASVTVKGKYRCVRVTICLRTSYLEKFDKLFWQIQLGDIPVQLDIFNNQEFKESFNWEAIKLVKTPKGSKLIGYFSHHDDLIKALRQPFIISNKSYNWSHDTFNHTKSPDKKSRDSNTTSKKPKNFSKDSTKKNKPKSRTSSSSFTGSIAEVLATLVKLLMKQESKKSRKHSKSHGGSKAN